METQDHIKRAIIKNVEELQGGKAMQIAMRVAVECADKLKSGSGAEVADAINEMVRDGEIIEVEFMLPFSSYRARSFLLPKGTKVYVSPGPSIVEENGGDAK